MTDCPMKHTASQLSDDSQRIWRAGVAAVAADRLVQSAVSVDGNRHRIEDDIYDLAAVRRIAVVGGGKAGAAMAAGLEAALGSRLLAAHDVTGWVNVPEGTERPLSRVHLHPARPAESNEPTQAAVEGCQRILDIVAGLEVRDLCIVLLSGGGSALLPAPAADVSLADKIAVTRLLSDAGANIEELNLVRRHLSRIKGGGLARACRAGQLVALIISDVLGDRLEAVASGPTVATAARPQEAIAVLDRFGGRAADSAARVYGALERQQAAPPNDAAFAAVRNYVIGNNARAVDAAGLEAERLGYNHAMLCAREPEGLAEDVGRHLAEMAIAMRSGGPTNCLISGGEPVVRLVESSRRGRGGRNQQLALAALEALASDGSQGIVICSGGTDGEDGPTDAAGAVVDADVVRAAREKGLDPRDYLARNDAYSFFQQTGGLLVTGPTGTNVCDVRVVLVDRPVEGP